MKVCIFSGTASSQQPASSQPITVQIQHTDQGTRLVLPSNQLSQLPGNNHFKFMYKSLYLIFCSVGYKNKF